MVVAGALDADQILFNAGVTPVPLEDNSFVVRCCHQIGRRGPQGRGGAQRGSSAVASTIDSAHGECVIRCIGQAGDGVAGGAGVAAADGAEGLPTVAAHFVADDRVVSGIAPAEADLLIARGSGETGRRGRYRQRGDGHAGCRTLTGTV